MEIYENEHDQVDAIKRFFAENGKALVVGVILGVGALVGWRYWNNHQADSARGASLSYENTVSAIRADQPQTLTAAEKFAADNKTPTVHWLRWKWLSSTLIRTNWIKPLLSCLRALLPPVMKI